MLEYSKSIVTVLSFLNVFLSESHIYREKNEKEREREKEILLFADQNLHVGLPRVEATQVLRISAAFPGELIRNWIRGRSTYIQNGDHENVSTAHRGLTH